MNLVNNLSNNSNKASAIPANILAALNNSLSSGQLTDKLFSDILSQNQPPPAPKNNTQAQTQTDANGGVQTDQNTDTGDNQGDANSTPQPAVQAPVAQHWTVVGKPQHDHTGKTQADKGKSQTDNNSTDNVSAAAQTNADTNTPANQTDATTTATVAANNNQDDGPSNTVSGDASGSDDANANADAGNNQILAADLNSAVAQPIVPAAQTPAVSQPTDPAASDGTTNTDNNMVPVANSSATDPQLTLLLMQLERLTAAAKLTAPVADTTANTQDPNLALIAPTNTQGKTDLKTLLAAITKSNVTNFLGGNTLTDPTNNAVTNQDAQNAGTAANAPPVTQNTQQPAAPTSAQQTAADKWMNDNFANLFNVTGNNQVNTNSPVTVNAAAAAGITLGNSDGAALDADAQGQNQPGSRDITANTGLNNNPLPAAGTTQGTNPYDFASELSNLRATKGGATGLPTPVEQVVLQLRNGLSKDGSTQMTIQLRPAELGRIDVKLNVSSDGKVQGTVTADNPTTLNLLLKDVRGLERALQDAGLRADSGSLQFNLRGDGQAGNSFNQTANNSSGFYGDASQDASTSLPAFADAAETYYLTPGGVNMRV